MVRPIYLFGIISCICLGKGFSKFRRAPGLAGRLCVEKVFSRSFDSLTKCAVLCVSSSGCARFHFFPGTNVCIGCSASSELQAPPTVLSDAVAYVLGDQPSYIGCYQDGPSRILSTPYLTSSTSMTNELCFDRCTDLGFIYSGTESRGECMCGNSFPEDKILPESDCALLCTGDQSQVCGGPWIHSIYT